MNVPKLRFKEFDGEWEEYSLADIAEFIKGKGISKDNLSAYGEPCILYGELYTKYKEVTSIIYSKTNIESRDLIKSKKFDVLIPSSGETAEDIACSTCVVQEDVLVGGDLNILRFEKDVDGRFISYQINGIKKRELSKYAQGATVVHLYSQGIKKLDLKIPTIEEQKKISELLLSLDKKIQLQQQKIDLLHEQKKGFLQKMFPKAGETQPEMRFDGFVGDWEERKLGEHAKYRRGSFPQPYGNKEWYDGEGAMPFVQVVDVNEQLTLVDNTKQKISVLAQPKSVFVPKGKVVVTLQGSIGRVAITQYDSYVDRTLLIFEDYEKKTNEYFWAYTIQQKFEIEKQKAPGGTIKTITKEALSDFEVYLPNYEEQQKIGSFFKKLDDTIAIHKRKLDLYKEQKKGFMQQMFI